MARPDWHDFRANLAANSCPFAYIRMNIHAHVVTYERGLPCERCYVRRRSVKALLLRLFGNSHSEVTELLTKLLPLSYVTKNLLRLCILHFCTANVQHLSLIYPKSKDNWPTSTCNRNTALRKWGSGTSVRRTLLTSFTLWHYHTVITQFNVNVYLTSENSWVLISHAVK